MGRFMFGYSVLGFEDILFYFEDFGYFYFLVRLVLLSIGLRFWRMGRVGREGFCICSFYSGLGVFIFRVKLGVGKIWSFFYFIVFFFWVGLVGFRVVFRFF